MRTPRRSEKAGFDVAGLSALLVAAFLFGVGGCSGVDSDADTAATDPQPTPKPGESSFATAGARDGAETPENEQAEAGAGGRRGSFAAPSKRGRKRSIEEGDVYEVVRHSDQILNLNRYRGLQVVDFSDPRHPSVIGRARLHGDPVEMYLVGNKVYALLNDWQGYRPRASHFLPRRVSGSVVAVVDISDPTDPSVVETKRLSGEIRTSRLTRGRGREALFVVSEAHSEQGQRTKVRSFSVSGRGELKRASMLDLGGDVTDVRGIDNRLLVARRSDDRNDDASRVAVVDISDPSGRMVMGGDVRVPGRVQNEHNMHVHGDVLRVVSGSTRGDEPLNHLQTFDISNIHDPSPVDHVSFAEDERLEATLFMADRAFVVTFQRTDPFHAIAIGPRGGLDLKSEFIVSGWNDYFVPVADGQRLVGIGVDNADGGRTMAVSLYDAVDLKNPEPMIDREKVQLDYSRSEANRDDRAFTVLRDATSVKTADGTVETGLVLLPFRGWDHDRDEYRAGVQVFTFSKNTLTPRGVMEHGSKVRRSFAADRRHDVTGNISRSELSLYDTSDPNSPVETGRVELSPSYVRYWQFGEHAVRRDGQRRSPRAYRRRRKSEGTDRLEIVPASEHPDTADPVAQISVPARSRIFRSGQRLVVAARARGDSEHATRLAVWDLSDPSNPVPEGTFLTDQVRPSGFVRWNTPRHRRAGGCPSCSVAREPGGGAGAPRRRGFRERPTRRVLDYRAAAVDGGLVFATAESNRELKGTRHVVQIEPERRLEIREACSWRERREGGCTYYGGAVHCRYLERPDGTRTPRRCSGTLTKCTIDSQGDRTCEKVGRYAVPTRRGSWSNEVHVRWKTFTFQMLDLSGKSPRLRAPVTMPTSERDVDFLARGSTVYVTHRTPYDKPGDSRPYRRYYVKTVDFSDPARPKIGGSVNIPGKLLAVRGDTLVTRDRLWGEHVAETSIDVLELRDGRAHLKAVRRFRNRRIDSVQIDRHRILVSHEPASAVPESETDGDRAARRLSVLQLDDGLRVSHAPRLPSWADLKRVVRGRALLSVPGGVLAADVGAGLGRTDAEFFPVRRWPADITVEAGQLYMAAGRYGLYRYDLPDVKAVVDRAAELRR